MDHVEYATCRSCGGQIVWMKSNQGKNIPVDAETVELGDDLHFDHRRHVSHFATCAQATEWRKKYMTRHVLKTEEPYFTRLWERTKTAELRLNNRAYEVGDTLELRKWTFEHGYSVKSIVATITDVEPFPQALREGWVMLSLGNLINCINQLPEYV